MTVFVSASDETAGGTQRSIFHHAGWIAPEKDWSEFFAPAWQQRVLDGPPEIPYLHMTEIRSEQWRTEYGLSRPQAESRVDEACNVIKTLGSLYPIGSRVDAGFFLDSFNEPRNLMTAKGARKQFLPDHLCFMGYIFVVLNYVHLNHNDAEKVDFMVERKDQVFDEINEFYNLIPNSLEAFNSSHLIPLLGELIPGGKERVPLQAADVLCWHSRRAETKTLGEMDASRYWHIAHRPGCRHEWTTKDIAALSTALLRERNENG